MPPRRFSLEEANAALNTVRPMLEEIQQIRASILARRPDLWPRLERAAGNGGSPELSRLVTEFDRLDRLVHMVLDTGAEIKDLAQGLIDFRALRGSREVYLCWRLGEDAILYWHELDAGFQGRQPINTF